MPVVDNVGQEPHHMLHPEAKLLEMLPLFGLLLIIHKDIRLGWVGGGPNADPTGAPVLHLLLRARLDAPDELLDSLERPPMMQKQVNEGGESPVIIYYPPGPGLAGTTDAQRPGFILRGGIGILPRSSFSEKSRSDPLDAVDRALDF